MSSEISPDRSSTTRRLIEASPVIGPWANRARLAGDIYRGAAKRPRLVRGVACAALGLGAVGYLGNSYYEGDEIGWRAAYMDNRPEPSESKTGLAFDVDVKAEVNPTEWISEVTRHEYNQDGSLLLGSVVFEHDTETKTSYRAQGIASGGAFGRSIEVGGPVFKFDVNKLLRGAARIQFIASPEAFYTETTEEGPKGETEITTETIVDRSLITTNTYWSDGPTLSPFTYTRSGARDFEDQTGIIEGAFRGGSAFGTVISFDSAQNGLNQTTLDSESFIKETALDIGSRSCAGTVDPDEIDASIVESISTFGQQAFDINPDTHTVRFKGKYQLRPHYEDDLESEFEFRDTGVSVSANVLETLEDFKVPCPTSEVDPSLDVDGGVSDE